MWQMEVKVKGEVPKSYHRQKRALANYRRRKNSKMVSHHPQTAIIEKKLLSFISNGK